MYIWANMINITQKSGVEVFTVQKTTDQRENSKAVVNMANERNLDK